ncbi:carbonate dehydratase [Deinococcus planocerae]|uniref:carbonate dehydratase n=1 Tax=Deinococcus planocerae TaxID=1737569 RepID=UPI000C7F200A|nr:carbonate dehydratase [Deinococcus planocerae]
MRQPNKGVILTALGTGLGLGAVALAGGADGLFSRFRLDAPVVTNGSFLSPQVELFGDVTVGRGSFVAGNTTLSADPGTRVCLGNETNLQDNILFLADGGRPFPAGAGGCDARATTAKNQVSVAHQATVENSTLGNFTFVGFHSRVVNSVLEDGVFVLHGALVQNVRVPQGRLVLTGAVVTTQAQANALPRKAEAQAEFQRDVLEVNAEFAEGYAEQYAAQGYAGVTGVSAAPRTSWNPSPVRPTLGANVRTEEFARIVGDVRLGEGSVVGRRTSIRADEGAPIVIGRGAEIGDQVTFHALKGTGIRIGDNLDSDDNIVFHGPLEMGNNVTVGDDAVVFRSKVGNDVTIGTGALVIDVTLPDGTVVPEGAKILSQADADALRR